jgi:hypothetical protein
MPYDALCTGMMLLRLRLTDLVALAHAGYSAESQHAQSDPESFHRALLSRTYNPVHRYRGLHLMPHDDMCAGVMLLRLCFTYLATLAHAGYNGEPQPFSLMLSRPAALYKIPGRPILAML